MSIDRTALLAAFEQAPGDVAGYMALSDLLQGDDDLVLSHAYAWMAAREIWPHKRTHYAQHLRPGRKVPARYGWAFYGGYVVMQPDSKTLGVLPQGLFRHHQLHRSLLSAEQKTFESHAAAVEWLAHRLGALRAVCEAVPPAPKDRGKTLMDVLTDEGV